MAVGYGARLPLTVNSEDGPFVLLKNIEQVATQNLKMLILTSPGERIMDAEFGVGLRDYLFTQYIPAVLDDLSSRIRQQTTKYLPYIRINNILFENPELEAQVGASLADNFLAIRIEFEIVPLNIGSTLLLPLTLEGSNSI
jgi:uncharacterized protein